MIRWAKSKTADLKRKQMILLRPLRECCKSVSMGTT
jgi:hypothetical protein